MKPVSRRDFVGLATATTALGLVPDAPVDAFSRPLTRLAPAGTTVHLSGDGIGLSPQEYASVLAELCRKAAVAPESEPETIMPRPPALIGP